MTDTRKQIIEIVEPYMNKETTKGCIIKKDWKFWTLLWDKVWTQPSWIDVIWHYDITAVDKLIRSSEAFSYIFEDGIDYICYEFKVINDGDTNVYYLPNKPPHLYTDQQDKALLEKLQNL